MKKILIFVILILSPVVDPQGRPLAHAAAAKKIEEAARKK